MRNWTTGLLLIIMFAVWFVYVMIWKPDLAVKQETMFGDMGLMAFVGIFAALWGKELAMKYTPHFGGYGDFTELEQSEPVDHVVLSDPTDVTKSHTFYEYPRHGCKVLAMGGGGTSGLNIVRDDLILNVPGDPANVWVYGVPEMYRMDAPPNGEYRDLACLPREIYDMVLQHKSFHPKGVVCLYADPVVNDPRKNVQFLQAMEYKDLWNSVNKENKGLTKQIDDLLKANSKYSSANYKNARSYAGEKPPMRERMRERREERSEEDDEER